MFKDFRAQIAVGLASLEIRGRATKSADFIPADAGGNTLERWGGSYVSDDAWFSGNGTDIATLAGDLWQSSAVAAGLNWILTAFGEARAGTWERDDDHRPVITQGDPIGLNALLDSPNADYDDSVLWAGTLISWNVDGNAYWFVMRDARGQVAGLDYIPHFLVEPKRLPGSRALVDYYEYRPSGQSLPTKMDKRDVIHFRFGIDPRNPMKGMAPLKSVACDVLTDAEASQYSATILRNKGIIGGLATLDAAASHDVSFDPAEFVSSWQAKTTGSQRGRIMAYDAPIKLQFPDTSPAKMDISALRRFPEARIAGVMGLPAVLLQFVVGLEKSHYNNVEQARKAGWEDNLLPTLRVLGKQATRQLVRQMPGDGGRYDLGFDTTSVRALQTDTDALHERARKDFQANLLTRKEARGEISMAGDEKDDARDDKFFADVAPPGSEGFGGPVPVTPSTENGKDG